MLSGCVVLSLEGGKPLLVFILLISVCNQRLLSVLNALQLLLLPLPPSLHAPQTLGLCIAWCCQSPAGMLRVLTALNTVLQKVEGRCMASCSKGRGSVGLLAAVHAYSFETLVAARCCTVEVLTNSRL